MPIELQRAEEGNKRSTHSTCPVSYTHLDVYKRQPSYVYQSVILQSVNLTTRIQFLIMKSIENFEKVTYKLSGTRKGRTDEQNNVHNEIQNEQWLRIFYLL